MFMKIEKDILSILAKELPQHEVQGIRFLNKVGEKTWTFRYVYRDGDYLSLSDEFSVKYEGLKLVICVDPKRKVFVSPGIFTSERDSSNIKNKKKYELKK